MVTHSLFTSRRLILALAITLALLATAGLRGNAIAPAVPDADDRCPVCGMLVAPHQDWLAQVRLADGSTFFFEGARDLFRYVENPGRYGDKGEVEIVGGFVTTYYDHRAIPYDSAWYVIGSDVRGPAGDELVAHSTLAHANDFIIEHGGTRVVRGNEVSSDILAKLP